MHAPGPEGLIRRTGAYEQRASSSEFPGAGEPCARSYHCAAGRRGAVTSTAVEWEGHRWWGGASKRYIRTRGRARTHAHAHSHVNTHTRARIRVAGGGGEQLRGFRIFNGLSAQPDQCVAGNWLREDVRRRRRRRRLSRLSLPLCIICFSCPIHFNSRVRPCDNVVVVVVPTH